MIMARTSPPTMMVATMVTMTPFKKVAGHQPYLPTGLVLSVSRHGACPWPESFLRGCHPGVLCLGHFKHEVWPLM